MKVWKMAERIGSHFEAECYEKNIIGIGWRRVGDLRKYSKNKEKFGKWLTRKLKKCYGYKRPISSKNQLIEFTTEMKKGHWVVLTRGSSVLAYGKVDGPYYHDTSGKSDIKYAPHRRKVKWKRKFFGPIKAKKLSRRFANKLKKQRTLVPLEISDLNELRKIKPKRDTLEITFAPTNEFEVIYLFSRHLKQLGFKKIIKMQNRFPDCIAVQANNKIRYIEFEYASKRAKKHARGKHGHKKFREVCDLVVCWKNNWSGCPVEVLELKKKLIRNR